MIKVLRSDSTDEMDLSGPSVDMYALVELLRAGAGEMSLAPDPEPRFYDRALARMIINRAAGRVLLTVEGDTLHIAGEERFLAVLADNLEAVAEAGDTTSHLHVDYYPGHYYLAEDSAALVVQLSAA
ncbi:hypothetical protein GCM10010435_36290 [Winogradskya consettensis]|uniref:Uncharacterized protein n=1 Tax=Winogradskya consettensis TaxID=113560 RepID=A0A919SZ08_9ACTN|nr:hypothetical protein [Actinoplanes consettensis]GIM81713.1 hypothetical protein Aco04nite_77960 [Actinoplanes consettensis]